MSRVQRDLVLASFEESYDDEALRRITHVLNVAEECDVPGRVGRTYAKYGVPDDCDATDITAIFEPCLRFIADAHARGCGVLVHCLEGISRSACVVLAYMCSRGWTYDDAYARIRSVRPHVDVFPRYEADTKRWAERAAASAVAEPLSDAWPPRVPSSL